MKEIRNIVDLYDRLRADGTACALATLVSVEGSAYRRIGARLLVAADGRYTGGISGGCLEGDALRRAQQAIYNCRPSKRTYDTLAGEDREIGVGLGCNGRIDVLFVPLNYADPANQVELLRARMNTRRPILLRQVISEGELTGQINEIAANDSFPAHGRSTLVDESGEEILYEVLKPELHLIVVGDNYDILPIVTSAHHLGWRITVIGTRRKFTPAVADTADRILDYEQVKQLSIDEWCAVACMSHDYLRDIEMVRHFLPLSPAYLGILGPRKRSKKMHVELLDDGLDLLGYTRLHTPIGLNIGAETPEEIAAAVVAEVISVFRGRDGLPLRSKPGTIHDR